MSSGELERLMGLVPKPNRGSQTTEEVGSSPGVCSGVKMNEGRVRLEGCKVIRGTQRRILYPLMHDHCWSLSFPSLVL